MKDLETLKVLLIDDDEDDCILTRALFGEMSGYRVQVEWHSTYEKGLAAMLRQASDVCLLDFRLGAKTGLELLKEALDAGSTMPVILLTGQGEHEIDVAAMKAGAADYLVKSTLAAELLERSIRYAVERKKASAKAEMEQASLAAFGAEIGLELTRRENLGAILHRCANLMVSYLDVQLSQIYILNPGDQLLQLHAAAGAIIDMNGASSPTPKLAPSREIIGDGKPVLVNQISDEACIPCLDWVKSEGIVAYGGYPLMLEDRLIGLMSIYSRNPLSKAIIQEMGSVANGIALCIERKRSEEALDASEVKYRTVVDSLKEVIFQLNEFGHWTSLNPAWKEITGFEAEESLGVLFTNFVHHDDRQRNSHIFLQLMERKLDYCRYETRLLTKGGKVCWVEVFAQLTHDTDGSIIGASGSFTNITDRKHAERQIQKLAAFPQVNPNPVLEFDALGKITYCNDAAQELVKTLGCDNLESILPPHAGEIARQSLQSGQKQLAQEVGLSGRTVSWSFFPVVASQVVHCYGVDNTEMLKLEAQYRHAQKLESVGQLAAGVAHDFNNILTVIQGYSDHLLARYDGDNALTHPLKEIANASRRAAALTRQLLMFSRKQVFQPTNVDINLVIRNLSNLLGCLMGEDVAIKTQCAPKLPPLQADTGMLEQIIMNLAVNARDAMPKGGQLLMATSTMEIDEKYVHLHPEARICTAICLAVTDTGMGMDQTTLQRIFEPFFTTKPVGKGTGLGLATVYGIVKQHQGWIEVQSEVGRGTTFKIYLPASARSLPEENRVNDKPAVEMGRNETVLLVEDEFSLRTWVKEILTAHRYNVIEAASGVDALRVWDEQNGKIDLLLTDMVMPEGLTGGDLARQLRIRKPPLKVIYTSGYSSEILGNHSELPEGPFLSKPFPAPQLVRMVRECLDSIPATQSAVQKN